MTDIEIESIKRRVQNGERENPEEINENQNDTEVESNLESNQLNEDRIPIEDLEFTDEELEIATRL